MSEKQKPTDWRAPPRHARRGGGYRLTTPPYQMHCFRPNQCLPLSMIHLHNFHGSANTGLRPMHGSTNTGIVQPYRSTSPPYRLHVFCCWLCIASMVPLRRFCLSLICRIKFFDTLGRPPPNLSRGFEFINVVSRMHLLICL